MASSEHADELLSNMRHPVTINNVPDEVLALIFSYVPVEDLVMQVPLVCRRWEYSAQDPAIWKGKVYKPSASSSIANIVGVLQQAPNLEGISVSRFATQAVVSVICATLALHQCNLKRLSITVNVSTSSCVRSILVKYCKSIAILDLLFGESFLLQDEFVKRNTIAVLTCVGSCTNLKFLTLSGIVAENTNIAAFKVVAKGCVNLQSLDIENCKFYSPSSLMYLVKRDVDTITSLSLPWSFLHEEGSLVLVSMYCQKLEKLSVMKPLGFFVIPRNIEALKNMNYLKEISFPGVKDNILRDFISVVESGALKNLEKLVLPSNSWVKNEFLDSVIRYCPNMKFLDLLNCYDLTSPGFEAINLLKHLQYLNLEGCVGLREKAILCIVECKSLRYLNVSRICSFTRHALLLCCEKLKRLEELHIIVDHIYENDMNYVPKHLSLFLCCIRGTCHPES